MRTTVPVHPTEGQILCRLRLGAGHEDLDIDLADTELAKQFTAGIERVIDLPALAVRRRSLGMALNYQPAPLTVVGHGKSGKDAFARMLHDFVGSRVRFRDGTSSRLTPLVRPLYGQVAPGSTTVADYEQRVRDRVYDDRRKLRTLWYELGNVITREEPAFLVAATRQDNDVIVGVRRKVEFEAAKRLGIVTTAVWIERPGVEPDRTLELTEADCDITVRNDGDMNRLRERAFGLARLLKW